MSRNPVIQNGWSNYNNYKSLPGRPPAPGLESQSDLPNISSPPDCRPTKRQPDDNPSLNKFPRVKPLPSESRWGDVLIIGGPSSITEPQPISLSPPSVAASLPDFEALPTSLSWGAAGLSDFKALPNRYPDDKSSISRQSGAGSTEPLLPESQRGKVLTIGDPFVDDPVPASLFLGDQLLDNKLSSISRQSSARSTEPLLPESPRSEYQLDDEKATPRPSACDSFTRGLSSLAKMPACLVSGVYAGCRSALKFVQRVLEKYPRTEYGLALVCAGASGIIAYSSPVALGALFLPNPYVVPGPMGNILSLVCSILTNIALLLGFKLGDNIRLTLRARDRITDLRGIPWALAELFWLYLFVNYVAESIAQAQLTAESYGELYLQIPFFTLGWLGFTLARSAAIARILFLLVFPADAKNVYKLEDSQGRLYDRQPISIMAKLKGLVRIKHELPPDERIVDFLGNVVTGGLMIANLEVVFKMYSLKLLKGLQFLNIDICSGDKSCQNVEPWAPPIANALSVLNFIFFYFPIQDALLHGYRYLKSTTNYLQHKGVPVPAAGICTGFSGIFLISLARGSIGGLLTPIARGPADYTATTALMMFVNTTPALKELLKFLEKRRADTSDPGHDVADIPPMPTPPERNLLSRCYQCLFSNREERAAINESNFEGNAYFQL